MLWFFVRYDRSIGVRLDTIFRSDLSEPREEKVVLQLLHLQPLPATKTRRYRTQVLTTFDVDGTDRGLRSNSQQTAIITMLQFLIVAFVLLALTVNPFLFTRAVDVSTCSTRQSRGWQSTQRAYS